MPTSPLKAIADNPELLRELRALIEKHFQVELDPTLDDARLGQVVRASLTAKKALQAAFREIERHKTPSEPPKTVNPAR